LEGEGYAMSKNRVIANIFKTEIELKLTETADMKHILSVFFFQAGVKRRCGQAPDGFMEFSPLGEAAERTALRTFIHYDWQVFVHDKGGSEKVGAYQCHGHSGLLQSAPDLQFTLLSGLQPCVLPYTSRFSKIVGLYLSNRLAREQA
jgi:hypothetical protein